MKVDCHLVVTTCDLCPETNHFITLQSTKSIFVVTLRFHSPVPLIKKMAHSAASRMMPNAIGSSVTF